MLFISTEKSCWPLYHICVKPVCQFGSACLGADLTCLSINQHAIFQHATHAPVLLDLCLYSFLIWATVCGIILLLLVLSSLLLAIVSNSIHIAYFFPLCLKHPGLQWEGGEDWGSLIVCSFRGKASSLVSVLLPSGVGKWASSILWTLIMNACWILSDVFLQWLMVCGFPSPNLLPINMAEFIHW